MAIVFDFKVSIDKIVLFPMVYCKPYYLSVFQTVCVQFEDELLPASYLSVIISIISEYLQEVAQTLCFRNKQSLKNTLISPELAHTSFNFLSETL